MPRTDRTVVRRAGQAPLLDEAARPAGEAVAAVGIADAQRRPLHRLALGHEQIDPVAPLADRQQRHGAVLDAHLDREPLAGLAVVERQRNQPHRPFGDGEMGRAVVPQHHDVVVEIQ